MCDPVSITTSVLAATASIASAAMSAHAQKKAAKLSKTPQAPTPIERVEQSATTLAQPRKQQQQPQMRNLGSLNQNFNSNPINTAANIGSDYNNIGLNIGG